MSQKDVGNKIPIYKLKTTKEVMDFYDEWGNEDKYNKDMVDWDYSGPKETVSIFKKYAENKDMLIFDAGCGTGLVGKELQKFGYNNFHFRLNYLLPIYEIDVLDYPLQVKNFLHYKQVSLFLLACLQLLLYLLT